MDDTISAETQLRQATARLLADCASATDAQWRFRPAPGAWSMADVVQHVAVSNGNIGRLLAKRLLESPLDGRRPDVLDAEIPYLFYRGEEPPDVAPPTGEWTGAEAAVGALEASVRSILQWSAGVTADLRAVGVAHPAFGTLDGVQWLLFTAAHTERHRAQLVGLVRHRGFPSEPVDPFVSAAARRTLERAEWDAGSDHDPDNVPGSKNISRR